MQYLLLDILKCPLSKTNLKFELINEFEKKYKEQTIKEIKDGLLFSETGLIFPVIDGIPRLLIESFYDHADFLKQHLPDFENRKRQIEKDHKSLLEACIQKNKRSKRSFELEWSFLEYDKSDKIWRDEKADITTIFLNETGEGKSFYTGRSVIDIGSGHGKMTSRIAGMASLAIGIELSKAVEKGYQKNQQINAWYVQGDLQYLPFAADSFDVLYSSGVIHHTNDTEHSLGLIEPVLKPGGNLCLWLYHPQKDRVHSMILGMRNFTKRLPLKLAFIFLMIFVFPFTFLLKKIKGRKELSYREEVIDLLDQFTPEFRYETTHDQAKEWLKKRKYEEIAITTQNQFGFSIAAKKQIN